MEKNEIANEIESDVFEIVNNHKNILNTNPRVTPTLRHCKKTLMFPWSLNKQRSNYKRTRPLNFDFKTEHNRYRPNSIAV